MPEALEAIASEEASLLAGVLYHPRVILARGEGSWVWDSAGRRYLDFTAGLGVAALGHGRRDLALLLADQFATLGHCSNLYGNLPALELARRLTSRSFATKIWFANSGTEANEAALKFARLHGRMAGGPRKRGIVAFRGGFHGRTMGALAVTHHPSYRLPFSPLVPGVRFADFNDLDSAARRIDATTCAVLVEPVQGEGGVVAARPGFLDGLRRMCDERDALLIFDEVQCGLGRLGTLHAYESYGVRPDIVTLAKPLAGGLPLGAVLMNERASAALRPGQHGSTFSGGPAVCAVAVRVFDLLSDTDFLRQVRERGHRLHAGLSVLQSTHALFREVRGRGLMQGLALAAPGRNDPAEFVRLARRQGLLITRAGEDAIRFLPPLNCTDEEIDQALVALEEVSRRMAGRRRLSAAARGRDG